MTNEPVSLGKKGYSMKVILLLMVLIAQISLACAADTVSGIVRFEGKPPAGVLFITAKKYNSKMAMPLAVKKIEAPKFPVKFELSQKDAMMKSIPFEGPFKIMAKISPSGGAMDKSGPIVMLDFPVNIGHKDLELVLKNQK